MRISFSHSTSVSIIEKGNRIAVMAMKWPTDRAIRARTRADVFCSNSAAETAKGQPMPGFTPWYMPEKMTAPQRAITDVGSSKA